MPSLVLEGGSFRGVFSAGAMDALLDNDLLCDYVIGVSAGIANGVSYCSLQNGRNINIIRKFRNDPRYYGKRNFLTDRSIFGVKFVFNIIPTELLPFDTKALIDYPGKVYATVTNAITGKAEYLDVKKMHEFDAIIATCSIPGAFPPKEINGVPYFDGGVSDSIPILKAIEDGNKKHIIVLTQPIDFIKELDMKTRVVAKYIEKKYPNVAKDLLNRAQIYNATVETCHKLEELGVAVIIQPSHPINSTEDNVAVLEQTYFEGKQAVYNNLNRIKALFD